MSRAEGEEKGRGAYFQLLGEGGKRLLILLLRGGGGERENKSFSPMGHVLGQKKGKGKPLIDEKVTEELCPLGVGWGGTRGKRKKVLHFKIRKKDNRRRGKKNSFFPSMGGGS